MNRKHSDEEALECYNLNRAGLSFAEIARAKGYTKDVVGGMVWQVRKKLPPEFSNTLSQPLTLTGDQIVVGDVHVPCTDYGFASLVKTVATKLQIKSLVIAGDFFNMDVFSEHPALEEKVPWAKERDAGRVLLREWVETFDTITILMGNHDRRLQKFTEGAVGPGDIFGMLIANPKITVSNYSWCVVRSGGQEWRITHPKNYASSQLIVAADLALKYQQNIISFHEHHIGKGWDKFGRYVICNGGTLVDPESLAYVQLEDNRMAGMMRGFVALRNGSAEVIGTAPFTDWTKYLN